MSTTIRIEFASKIAFLGRIRLIVLLLMATATSLAYGQTTILDHSFGDTGVVTSSFFKVSGQWGESVVIQPDGKIVLAGVSFDSGLVYSKFGAVRYNSDGSIDTSFGKRRYVRVAIAGGDSSDECFSAALQSDGKIVLAGDTRDAATGNSVFAAARLDSDGSVDSSFGNKGTVMTTINGGNWDDRAYTVLIQPDGKIILAGNAEDQSYNSAFAAVRLNTNGGIDTTFGSDGDMRVSGSNGMDDQEVCAAMQPDGKILLGGYSWVSNSRPVCAFGVVRLDTNGEVDTSFGVGGLVRVYIANGYGVDI